MSKGAGNRNGSYESWDIRPSAVLGGGFPLRWPGQVPDVVGRYAVHRGRFLKGATGGAWLGSTGVVNPTHPFWVSLAGNASLMTIVDTLVVFGECAIGAALILGLATRFAGVLRRPPDDPPVRRQLELRDRSFNEQLMYGLIAGTIRPTSARVSYVLDSVVEKLAHHAADPGRTVRLGNGTGRTSLTD